MKWDYFSPELTTQSMYFEIGFFIFFVLIFVYGIKNYRFFLWRFFALFFGVFCFEGLTGALWINSNLGTYAYIHNDISWVMTLAWSSIIMFTKMIYDKIHKKTLLLEEFSFVVVFSSIFGLLLLILLKDIGVFSYSQEMQEIVSSGITIFGRPLEAIVYFPVFMFSTFTFYKYWELAIYDKNLFHNYKISFGKDIIISIICIFSIGYLVHPLLNITNIFSYISLTLGFLLILFFTSFIINFLKEIPLFIRFIVGTSIFTIWGVIFISILVSNNLIRFSSSVLKTHTEKTITIPYTRITDVEFVGILLFSYLLLAIIKYFKIITDNKKIILDDKKITFKGFNSLINFK